MKVNARWSIFWLTLGLCAAVGEGVALLLPGRGDTFSEQVWFVLGMEPWLRYPLLFVCGAFGAWLIFHFFGRRD